jgi:site-specific DNA-adenine methylase
MDDVKAPFPWFGGKRRVAPLVWAALGDVDNYVEPFAGSLAVLLERPLSHRRAAETVNDRDYYLANFWRALAAEPEAVAAWCDWPVNEVDLFARHLWLVNEGRARLAANMDADPDWYDTNIAGWWVWGINAWIGAGWCHGTGPHTYDTLGTAGQGVNRKRPHLGAGQGVNRKRPHLGAGQGVNRKRPHLGNREPGEAFPQISGTGPLYDYMWQLAGRLRRVRVCCGDWARTVTDGALAYGATVGVFLDPPYLGDVRTKDLYAADDHHIAHDVRAWCAEHGGDRRLRVVLAGYEDEHAGRLPGWTMHTYHASRAYGSANGGGVNDANRHNERLWLSPHCLVGAQQSLFEEAG